MAGEKVRQDDAAEGLLSPQPRVLKLVWQHPGSPSGRMVPPLLPESPKTTRFPPPDVLLPDHDNAQLHERASEGHESRHPPKGTLKLATPLVRRVSTAAGRNPTEMRRADVSATRRTRCWGLPRRDLLQPGQEDELATEDTVQSKLDWVSELLSRPAQPGLHAPHQIRIAPHLIRGADSRSPSPSRETSPTARDRSGAARSGNFLKPFSAARDRSGAASFSKSIAPAKKLRAAATAVRHSIAILRDARLLALERSRSEGEAPASRPVTASVRLPSCASSPGTPLHRAPSKHELLGPWQNDFPPPELPSPKFLRRSNSSLSRTASR